MDRFCKYCGKRLTSGGWFSVCDAPSDCFSRFAHGIPPKPQPTPAQPEPVAEAVATSVPIDAEQEGVEICSTRGHSHDQSNSRKVPKTYHTFKPSDALSDVSKRLAWLVERLGWLGGSSTMRELQHSVGPGPQREHLKADIQRLVNKGAVQVDGKQVRLLFEPPELFPMPVKRKRKRFRSEAEKERGYAWLAKHADHGAGWVRPGHEDELQGEEQNGQNEQDGLDEQDESQEQWLAGLKRFLGDSS